MDVLATAMAALASPGQHDRLLRLHTSLGRDVLVAETLRARESFDGGGFRLELTALSTDAHLPLDGLLGQPLLLELLTADSRTDLRPFHGHVTACELLGSNGGLARYRLVVEPWLAFLGQRVDSYVFQDMTVVEIVEDLFADYGEAGSLVPAWRWDLADRSAYPRRSLTTQYEETDLAFLHRLLADEGIFYWFEHEGAKDDETLGRHVMVLADHMDACTDAGAVRFHRADATERKDAIQQWSPVRRWQTGRLARASWDYRSLAMRPASAEGEVHGDVVPEDEDTAGPYAWIDGANGELRARAPECFAALHPVLDGQVGLRPARYSDQGDLLPPHPNPTSDLCSIHFNVFREAHVKVGITDMYGREIVTLIDERKAQGRYTTQWNGIDGAARKVSTGTYLAHFIMDGEVVKSQRIGRI